MTMNFVHKPNLFTSENHHAHIILKKVVVVDASHLHLPRFSPVGAMSLFSALAKLGMASAS